MRKINLIWIIALILVIPNVLAYTDCTPSACSSGYTDNGVVCQGSTCVRNCTISVCKGDWTQVHSDTVIGFNDVLREDQDSSTSYTPTDGSKCYNFTYRGSSTETDVDMTVDDVVPSPDCDSNAIGGFLDNNQFNPWFDTMDIGNVGSANQGNPEYDYIAKIARAWSDTDDDAQYRSDARASGRILCAPNQVACNGLGGGLGCDTDCYNRATYVYIQQGYYNDTTPSSDTEADKDTQFYNDKECGDNFGGANDFVDGNRLDNTAYYVYESTTTNENSDQTCDRIHEAPSVSNVRVLPEIPNAGQDLLCNYTYSDPENFTEQNSSYEWWKNSVNQNINSQILNKNNLTPGDSWYCKVIPSDGLLIGTQQQSTNIVTLRNATQNPNLYVNNQAVWNNTGYYGTENNVFEFGDELNNALSSCTADAQGFCNLSLTFSSDNVGLLNVSIENSAYYTENQSAVIQVPSLKIFSLTETYSNLTRKIFEFVILNNGSAAISNVQWQFDTGDNYITNSTSNISSLSPSEQAFVYMEYNYSSAGTYSIRANATGVFESTMATAFLESSTVVNSTDQNKFFIKNASGSNIAWFGDAGNIVIKGTLEQNSNFIATDNFAFKIRNNANDVLIIENNGSMYIDGTLAENQATIPINMDRNEFRFKWDGEFKTNINESGYIFTKGTLTQNGNP